MGRRITKILQVLLLLLISGARLYSYDYLEKPLVIPSVRTLALGGFHAADTGDITVLFSNPGAFNAVEPRFFFPEFTLGLKGPVNDLAGLVIDAVVSGTSIGDLFAEQSTLDLLSGIYTGLSLVGPIYLGYVGNGLGLGLFNNTDIVIRQSAPMTLQVQLKEDIFVYGGYTYRVPLPVERDHILDVGLVLKGGVRGVTSITRSYAELANLDFGGDTLLKSPFDFVSLIGLDVGVLYQYKDELTLGLTALDVFTPTTKKRYDGGISGMFDGDSSSSSITGVVPFSLNFGLSYAPQWKFLSGRVSDLVFLLDYKNILGSLVYPENSYNPWLNLSFGAELTLLEVLDFRFGMNQGLFAAGFGIRLSFVTMNVAVFGTEMGTQPGMQPLYNVMLGFQISR